MTTMPASTGGSRIRSHSCSEKSALVVIVVDEATPGAGRRRPPIRVNSRFVRDRCTRSRNRARGGATRTPACDHRPMSEPDPARRSVADVARALAEEVSGAIELLSEIDLDEIARAASAEGERARQWIDDLGRWLREQSGAWEHGLAPADRSMPGRPTGEDPLRHAGPHPLDLPTADQGLALAALDSGRGR